MQYRIVKEALTDLLDAYSLGQFSVIGRQRQNKSAETVRDALVQVYFTEGQFPKNAGRMRGDKTHEISIDIDLTVSGSAKGNVSILNSETASDIQKAQALAAVKEASEVVDTKIDNLIHAVFNIVMDARNEDLGLTPGTIASRWLERIQKDTLLERGDLLVKTANLRYTCRVMESVQGDLGNTPDTVIFNSVTPVDGGSSTGIIVENDNT